MTSAELDSVDMLAVSHDPSQETFTEELPWDQVVIALEDDNALTRSIARAMGEHLLGVVSAGGETPSAAPETSPIPADRTAGVTTHSRVPRQ